MDHSLPFLRDPYRFIGRACDAFDSDVVEIRLMLQPTLCLRGPDAARLFYDKALFTRVRAAPEPVRATLFGKGALQGLDGAEHLARKRFFLQAAAPERVEQLLRLVEQAWHQAARQWPVDRPFSLYRAVQPVLARAACTWAGVPLLPQELAQRTRQLVSLFDDAVSGPIAHLRARHSRQLAERWLAGLVQEVRAGLPLFHAGTIAREAAELTDASGRLLPPRVAAVELLNVLRPTVAVSVYLVLAAHALHLHPQWRPRLARGDALPAHAFAQEVRRFYPFFPAIAARTMHEFTWRGHRFPAHRRTLLDIYGTNHDPRSWEAPEQFRPERFLHGDPGPFAFLPQGGARAEDHHRCPGEDMTLALMQAGLRLLAASDYAVPEQDLRIRMRRMPALPVSGFVLLGG